MNLFRLNVRVPWRLQSARSKFPKECINVVGHDRDHRTCSAIEVAEEDLVAFSSQNTERSGFFGRCVISLDVLEIENLRIELERVNETAASDLRNDGHASDPTAEAHDGRFKGAQYRPAIRPEEGFAPGGAQRRLQSGKTQQFCSIRIAGISA